MREKFDNDANERMQILECIKIKIVIKMTRHLQKRVEIIKVIK